MTEVSSHWCWARLPQSWPWSVLLAAKKGGRPAEERPEIREERPERRQYVPSPEKELLEEEPVSEPEEAEIGEEISFDDASIEDAPVPEDFVQVEETVEEEAKKDEDDDDGFEDLEI